MNAAKLINDRFKVDSLFQTYIDYVKNSAYPGSDGINRKHFENKIGYHLNIIERKVNNCSYHFAPYKETLIPRKKTRTPRVVEKPTIRDKVVLRSLYTVLSDIYKEDLDKRLLHKQIKEINHLYAKKTYSHVIRMDIVDFFPSIDHDKIISILKNKIRKKQGIYLIEKAIQNISDADKKSGLKKRVIGIPQGLAISSTLANIYLFKIDHKYMNRTDIRYFRFVDDVLIFCNTEINEIKKELLMDFKKLKLTLHNDNTEKFCSHEIEKEFSFLGYLYKNNTISVRSNSIEKIHSTIINILSAYKYSKQKNKDLLLFKINLRITGCMINNKKYGWLFYYSQINKKSLLFSLDSFINKQLSRYNIKIRTKRFVKAWNELIWNLSQTKYIPNFDNFSRDEKEAIVKLFNKEYDVDQIDYYFNLAIYKEIKDLEKDMANLS